MSWRAPAPGAPAPGGWGPPRLPHRFRDCSDTRSAPPAVATTSSPSAASPEAVTKGQRVLFIIQEHELRGVAQIAATRFDSRQFRLRAVDDDRYWMQCSALQRVGVDCISFGFRSTRGGIDDSDVRRTGGLQRLEDGGRCSNRGAAGYSDGRARVEVMKVERPCAQVRAKHRAANIDSPDAPVNRSIAVAAESSTAVGVIAVIRLTDS